MGHMHLNGPIEEDVSLERSTSKQKGPRIAPRAFLLFTPFSFAYAFFFRVETLRVGVFLAAVFFLAPLEAAADVFAAGFTTVATRLVVRLGLASVSASADSSDLRVLRRRLGVSAAGSTMGSETAIGATAGSSTGAGSASVPETASVRRRRVSRGIFGGSGAKVKLGGGGSTATAAGS